MRPDPGREVQERLVAVMSTRERTAVTSMLRRRGLWTLWQQVDGSGISDPVERAEFILRRLYPEMPEEWFVDVLGKLAALHAAGKWHGFQRPSALR
jgi:hypothetical protein